MKKRRIILLIIIILTLAFIWGQSLLPSDTSSKESGFVRTLITPVLEIVVGRGNVTDLLVRKLAHFTEYAALGLEFGLLAGSGGWFYLLAGPLAAVIDEMVMQRISGRGSTWTDVLIDSCGFFLLFLITKLIIFLARKKR